MWCRSFGNDVVAKKKAIPGPGAKSKLAVTALEPGKSFPLTFKRLDFGAIRAFARTHPADKKNAIATFILEEWKGKTTDSWHSVGSVGDTFVSICAFGAKTPKGFQFLRKFDVADVFFEGPWYKSDHWYTDRPVIDRILTLTKTLEFASIPNAADAVSGSGAPEGLADDIVYLALVEPKKKSASANARICVTNVTSGCSAFWEQRMSGILVSDEWANFNCDTQFDADKACGPVDR